MVIILSLQMQPSVNRTSTIVDTSRKRNKKEQKKTVRREIFFEKPLAIRREMWYNRQVNESWPLSQTVKTSPSHGEDMGSIPVGVTTGSFKDEAANLFRAISSAGRAPGSQSGGQGFDPPMVHHMKNIKWIFFAKTGFLPGFLPLFGTLAR